jgi:hypothetical protein
LWPKLLITLSRSLSGSQIFPTWNPTLYPTNSAEPQLYPTRERILKKSVVEAESRNGRLAHSF